MALDLFFGWRGRSGCADGGFDSAVGGIREGNGGSFGRAGGGSDGRTGAGTRLLRLSVLFSRHGKLVVRCGVPSPAIGAVARHHWLWLQPVPRESSDPLGLATAGRTVGSVCVVAGGRAGHANQGGII